MSSFFDERWERELADGVGLASLIPLRTKATVTQVADGVGFEPTDAFTSLVFKTSALNHSATHPAERG